MKNERKTVKGNVAQTERKKKTGGSSLNNKYVSGQASQNFACLKQENHKIQQLYKAA